MTDSAHCYVCKKYKPKEDFYNCSARGAKVSSRCKVCDNVRREERRNGVPPELRTQPADYWDNLTDAEFIAAEDRQRAAYHDANMVAGENHGGAYQADGVRSVRGKGSKNRTKNRFWGKIRMPGGGMNDKSGRAYDARLSKRQMACAVISGVC